MPTETIIGNVKKKSFGGLDKIGKFNYHQTRWRKLAALHKKHFPLCCEEGCFNPVHTTDHDNPISQGGDAWDWDNLRSRCKRHNASKTAKQRCKGTLKEGGV